MEKFRKDKVMFLYGVSEKAIEIHKKKLKVKYF